MLGALGQGMGHLEKLRQQATVGKCAEMVGVLQSVFDMTIAYAREREQFGRPIGTFQAIQYHCADMIMDLDGARFITDEAAWEMAEGLTARMEAAMAGEMAFGDSDTHLDIVAKELGL
jgi:3-oxocholest-4-en-26-oyl-CoA dehydrogenase beta subunit